MAVHFFHPSPSSALRQRSCFPCQVDWFSVSSNGITAGNMWSTRSFLFIQIHCSSCFADLYCTWPNQPRFLFFTVVSNISCPVVSLTVSIFSLCPFVLCSVVFSLASVVEGFHFCDKPHFCTLQLTWLIHLIESWFVWDVSVVCVWVAGKTMWSPS